ncbi:MAG: ribosome maturation factor RimM [Halioglobus sp.]
MSKGSCAEEMLVVGKITGCYGLKGWVKIQAKTETPENFMEFGVWYLVRPDEYQPVELDKIKVQGRGLVAHIKDVDDRTLAESYKGIQIAVPVSALPALPDGDYYWRDLQGLRVWCRQANDKVLLGVVDYLIETGANDVLVVKPCDGSIDSRERLIPYLPGNSVTRVDLQQGIIEVDWFVDDE